MRFPSLPNLVRTLYTISNATLYRTPRIANTLHRIATPAPRLMPTLPFIGALFGTSSSQRDTMSYPVDKPANEWQAQLSKGI